MDEVRALVTTLSAAELSRAEVTRAAALIVAIELAADGDDLTARVNAGRVRVKADAALRAHRRDAPPTARSKPPPPP